MSKDFTKKEYFGYVDRLHVTSMSKAVNDFNDLTHMMTHDSALKQHSWDSIFVLSQLFQLTELRLFFSEKAELCIFIDIYS